MHTKVNNSKTQPSVKSLYEIQITEIDIIHIPTHFNEVSNVLDTQHI